MKTRKLGRTGLEVSEICLGTMTWGRQNTEAEGHAQMDFALDHGVNFFDTAEVYPAPRDENYFTRTEVIIGNWFKARGNRDKVILASKVAGSMTTTKLRSGNIHLDRQNIIEAVEGSLKRLQTDYLDLYQTHWPDRPGNYFGPLGMTKIKDTPETVPVEETLEAMHSLVKAGKVRHIGVSNESPWGLMQQLQHGEANGLTRIAAIQNPYNLLNRSYEVALAEVSLREDVSLLAYSPLAMGLLSGKYRHGARPAGTRIPMFPAFSRYEGKPAEEAVEKYCLLAEKYGLNPVHLALAFILNRSFVASAIIGATNLEQLKMNIDASGIELSQEILKELDEIHREHTIPCP